MYSRWKLYKIWRIILLAVVLTGCGTSTTPVVKPTAAPIVTQTIIMQPASDESLTARSKYSNERENTGSLP